MATPAGELNKRLRLETPPATGDVGRSMGKPIVVATVWGKVEVLGGGATDASGKGYSYSQVRITIRPRKVLHGQRFVYVETCQAYHVVHVEDPGLGHRDTVCLCNSIDPSASPVEA